MIVDNSSLGWYNVDIRNKEKKFLGESKMSRIEGYTRIEIAYVSDCCGEYCREDAQCCPACGEHCEVIQEEHEVAC